jgi:hypothetical protein
MGLPMRSQAFFACTTKKVDNCPGRAAETRGAARHGHRNIADFGGRCEGESGWRSRGPAGCKTSLSYSAKAQSFVRQQWQSKHQSSSW